jgi:hypothetical protein
VRAHTAPTMKSSRAIRFCGFMVSGQLAAIMTAMELDRLT